MAKGREKYYIACTYNNEISNINMNIQDRTKILKILLSTPPYAVGRMGSECQTGMNPKYEGLCNIKEFPVENPESPFVNEWIEHGKELNAVSGPGSCSTALKTSVEKFIFILNPIIFLMLAKMFNF